MEFITMFECHEHGAALEAFFLLSRDVYMCIRIHNYTRNSTQSRQSYASELEEIHHRARVSNTFASWYSWLYEYYTQIGKNVCSTSHLEYQLWLVAIRPRNS
ncbi:hypothetical protein Plhal304r1_c005g0018721 [Plasmopara halstedii]